MAKKTKTKTENWLKLAAANKRKPSRSALWYGGYYPEEEVIIAADGYRLHADWDTSENTVGTSKDWHKLAAHAAKHYNTIPLNTDVEIDNGRRVPPFMEIMNQFYDRVKHSWVDVPTKELVQAIDQLNVLSTDYNKDTVFMRVRGTSTITGHVEDRVHLYFKNKETGNDIRTSIRAYASTDIVSRRDMGLIKMNLRFVRDALRGLKHSSLTHMCWKNVDLYDNSFEYASSPMTIGEYNDRMALIMGVGILKEEFDNANAIFDEMDREA